MGTHQSPRAKETTEINNMFYSTKKTIILFLIIVVSEARTSDKKQEEAQRNEGEISKGGIEAKNSLVKQRGKFFETRVLQIVQKEIEAIHQEIDYNQKQIYKLREDLESGSREIQYVLCKEAILPAEYCSNLYGKKEAAENLSG